MGDLAEAEAQLAILLAIYPGNRTEFQNFRIAQLTGYINALKLGATGEESAYWDTPIIN